MHAICVLFMQFLLFLGTWLSADGPAQQSGWQTPSSGWAAARDADGSGAWQKLRDRGAPVSACQSGPFQASEPPPALLASADSSHSGRTIVDAICLRENFARWHHCPMCCACCGERTRETELTRRKCWPEELKKISPAMMPSLSYGYRLDFLV